MKSPQTDEAASICFGFDRQTDERSLATFLRLFARPELVDALLPRLEHREILEIVDLLTAIMRRHLTEPEYHRLFLGDPDP